MFCRPNYETLKYRGKRTRRGQAETLAQNENDKIKNEDNVNFYLKGMIHNEFV